MTQEAKDINQLPDDGYIIFPLSMSRLQGDQSAEKCMEYLAVLDTKLNLPTNDVVFLYTNGLYFNADELAINLRKKTNGQMLAHRSALKKLILKKKTYFPSAFHFLPFDYVLLNSDDFHHFFILLKQSFEKDSEFKKLVFESLGDREQTEANVHFILEEIVVAHIIREHLVEFPKSLVKKDDYRLIVYPGPLFRIEAYVWQKKILPQKPASEVGRYRSATYNPQEKALDRFDDVDF